MFTCMFKGWNGLELDTIGSVSATYVDVGGQRINGVAFYCNMSDSFNWFIPIEDDNDAQELIRSVAGIYPALIDLSEFDALHYDDESEYEIDPDEWAWYSGIPRKKSLMEAALDKIKLRG